GSRSSPIGDDTGDTRPSFRSMRNSTGCDAGQSRLTGHSQHFTPGEEWVRPRTVIFSHVKLLVLRSGRSSKAKLYRRAMGVDLGPLGGRSRGSKAGREPPNPVQRRSVYRGDCEVLLYRPIF